MLGPAEAPRDGGADSAMRRPRFSFAVSRALSTAVVTIHGEVERPSVEELTVILRGVIDDQRNQTVVVDMRDVSGVDPSATALFRDAIGWARHRGADFYLNAPPPAAADRLTADASIRNIILV